MALEGGKKLKEVLKEIKEKAANTTMKVGILEGATNKDNESIPQYAAELTFGRWPFMQTTVQKHGKDWVAQVAHLLSGQNWNFVDALNVVGDIASKDMMNVVNKYPKSPPNSPATIAIKKAGGYNPFDQPLIHTGEMIRAISFGVDE